MMVPNYSSEFSSDVVVCWTVTYDIPALLRIEALTSLSGAKGELYDGLDKESGTELALPGLKQTSNL